jgi:serine protease Do
MAIVKIDPKQGETLPTIPIGDSSKLEVGEGVVAIGNALGLEGGPTVTAGIVGAIGRSIEEPGGAQLTDLIQTDAAINPGNSGGPLLNLRGELIGMNTAAPVDPNSGGAAQGIGFAISINQLRPLTDGFVKGQPLQRPFMGVVPQAVTSALQARYQLPTNTGILIGRVDANSPAAQAGWKAGDVIVRMDGKDLRTLNDLSAILQAHKPGDRVNATLVDRSGKQREAPITFGASPAQG